MKFLKWLITNNKSDDGKQKLKLSSLATKREKLSNEASVILRSLIIAGVATSWLFLYNDKNERFSSGWLVPLFIFISALISDLLQYLHTFIRIDQEYWRIWNSQLTTVQKQNDIHDITENVFLGALKYYKIKVLLTLLGFIVLFSMIIGKMFKNNQTNKPEQPVTNNTKIVLDIKIGGCCYSNRKDTLIMVRPKCIPTKKKLLK
jgi:hypothetical protein